MTGLEICWVIWGILVMPLLIKNVANTYKYPTVECTEYEALDDEQIKEMNDALEQRIKSIKDK